MQTTSRTLIALFSLLAAAPVASAESRPHPRPTFVRVKNAVPIVDGQQNVSSKIVYVHRCPEISGCSVRGGGTDDSRTDTSTIADGIKQLGEFPHGDAVWNAMFACVKKTFEPFDITVTDVDPGNVPHFENMVGGRPSDITSSPDLQNAGGVAPFDCSGVANAIVYTFAGVYGPDADELCWTSSQEIAHAFGLDHELLGKDPMTYLQGELPKRFRDVDAPCGESVTRTCQCPGATQNSYRKIVGQFGVGQPTPPEVTFERPADGRTIQPRYTVTVHALDDVRVDKVELFVDGVKAGEATTEVGDDFEVAIAADTTQGSHTLEARATDVQGVVASAMLTVTVGPPCTPDDGCTGDDVCVEGVCIPGPGEPGGLGSICQKDTECISHQCIDAGESHKYCGEACSVANAESCPGGFDCVANGDSGVCYPAPGGGCCDTSGTRPHAPLLLGLGIGLVLLRRRRARR